MDRTKGILAAGTFTGLVLITILALGFGNFQANTPVEAAVQPIAAEVMPAAADNAEAAQALQAWQTYSAELEQVVRTMQARETTYRQQLEAANQTILQLQDEINRANSAPAGSFLSHENETHESGEHDD